MHATGGSSVAELVPKIGSLLILYQTLGSIPGPPTISTDDRMVRLMSEHSLHHSREYSSLSVPSNRMGLLNMV